MQGDAGNFSDPDLLSETVKEEKGYINILFASAGVGELSKPLGSITEKNFEDIFNVNLRGTLFTVQKAMLLMKDGGSIILNSSIAGVEGFPGTTSTAPAKEPYFLSPENGVPSLKGRISVNVIRPGPIDTAIFNGTPQEMKNGFVSIIPMGRMGQPAEIGPPRSFWHQMTPASLPVLSCSSTAPQHKSNRN